MGMYSYMVEEDGDDLVYKNASSKKFEGSDLSDVAEECAWYDYNNCDGWEDTDGWQNGKTIVLFDNITEQIAGKFIVRAEWTVNMFTQEKKVCNLRDDCSQCQKK